MKFCRYGAPGAEKPALVDSRGMIRDLSDHIPDLIGSALEPQTLADLAGLESAALPEINPGVRLGPPVSGVGKFVCIGLNYADHAKESGLPPPDEPVIFMKATSSIVGPNDPIVLPKGSGKTDWEVELGIIIGRLAKDIAASEAMAHIAGYCIVNDVSERAFQLERQGQWTKGKSADSFGPVGPWLVTTDDIPDPQDLDLWLTVNGRTMQNGSTRTMIFGIAEIVAYVSQFMSLQPGDIISTGTPPGVGMGQTPPHYLRAGDRVELGIEGLGQQSQMVEASA
ncbi:MAG: fumarylacetoacetate hydrolase family protein [Rhodobacteraceae bacterium]|nr:fumarylacetoacetate hydrolase family protein [Paracoccaceae bacterium]